MRRGRQPEENMSRSDSGISQIFILIISNGEKILSNVNEFKCGCVKTS